ncbi:hypothetical protein L798_08665 [Zootermopsis nevadensis]|uniref:Uncharacterized protein n=1 Tax=Zootermopsis nevadensis TaxID=136037 RepID=A0A067RKA8_ZOONE|nr:hypothetical protein L798_08665 [Zootermopsis nevadensis]
MWMHRYLSLCCCVMTSMVSEASGRNGVSKVNRTSGSSKSRMRRFLVYPDNGSYAELIMGFGLPILIQDESLTMGTVIKLLYDFPTNSSVYLDSVFNRERRTVSKTSRWDIYSMLESACDRLGLDGRACVLRAICEAADTTLQYNGLAGEVLHVLLTPSTTMEVHRNYMDREYYAAERLGTDVSGSCQLLYPECEVGLLDFISKVEY